MKAISDLHNFMNDLPEAAVYDIRACLKPRRFASREVIFHGGDQPDHVFQLASGNVALCNYAVDGQEIILTKYQPGDWFGDTGILDGIVRSAYGKIYVLDPTALNDSSDHLTSFEPMAALYDHAIDEASSPESA